LKKKEQELENLKQSVGKQVEEAIKAQQQGIEKEAKKKAEKAFQTELKDLKEQVDEKEGLLEKAQKEELKLRKEQRQLAQEKKDFEIEMQRKYDEVKKQIYEQASKEVLEAHSLKDRERQQQIDGLKKQIGELQRKAEQGSQQLQGEVQEIELEDLLRDAFPRDTIEPTTPGTEGADILHKVCFNNGQVCGSILFESKDTKNWSNGWIAKVKKDQREIKADIAVIVTTILPQDVRNFSMVEGVVVMDLKSVVPVTVLLRKQLLEVGMAKNFSEGKNEKLEILFKYLTGTEFRQKVESIVEAFAGMMDDLQKEKRAMNKTWAKREKHLQLAFLGVAGMYGGMQGIMGSSLPEIKSLEMPLQLENETKDDNDEDLAKD